MGSNMAPLMVSRGGPLRPPPMGATESDRSWEIGLMGECRVLTIDLTFVSYEHHSFLVKKIFLNEGLKKKNYWKIPIRGGGSARVDFPIRKKNHVLKTLEIA